MTFAGQQQLQHHPAAWQHEHEQQHSQHPGSLWPAQRQFHATQQLWQQQQQQQRQSQQQQPRSKAVLKLYTGKWILPVRFLVSLPQQQENDSAVVLTCRHVSERRACPALMLIPAAAAAAAAAGASQSVPAVWWLRQRAAAGSRSDGELHATLRPHLLAPPGWQLGIPDHTPAQQGRPLQPSLLPTT